MTEALSSLLSRYKSHFLFLLCLVSGLTLKAESSIILLSADSLANATHAFSLRNLPWKFHPGDRPEWAFPGFRDDEWALVRSDLGKGTISHGWNGIGWFRLRLVIDASLNGQTLAFWINHDGASEIFINGARKGGYGKIGQNDKETTIRRAPERLIPFEVQDPVPPKIESTDQSNAGRLDPHRTDG